MTYDHVATLLSTHGPKARLILKLTAGTEMELRGNIFSIAQMDLFRERIRFSAPWTECLIELKDIEDINHDGRRLRIVMRTAAIALFPTQ